MTAEKKIRKIATKLLNEWDFSDFSREEFEEEFMNQSVNDLKDEMWRMFCSLKDVYDTLNM